MYAEVRRRSGGGADVIVARASDQAEAVVFIRGANIVVHAVLSVNGQHSEAARQRDADGATVLVHDAGDATARDGAGGATGDVRDRADGEKEAGNVVNSCRRLCVDRVVIDLHGDGVRRDAWKGCARVAG